MDLATLIALYPIAGELLRRAPQLQKWIERKARKEDPAFLLQLQSLEAITELKDGVSQLKDGVSQMKDGVSHLRSYTLNTAIMSAMLSNPDLSPEEIKAKFVTSAEVARDILETIEGIAP